MRSGSQTLSRNQYAPICREREATALNPGTQPAVERSKSNREWTQMHTNRRLTSAEWTRLLSQPRDFGAAGYEREAKLQADGRKKTATILNPLDSSGP